MAIQVLLCDAPEGIATLEYGMLRSNGDYAIEVATDGYRAVELAARTHPSVIVTEVSLPGLSGAELVRQLLVAAREAKVICWTSQSVPDAAAEILRAGAVGYLSKDEGWQPVIGAIGPVLEGGAVISPQIAARLLTRFADALHRERDLNRTLAETTMKLQEVTQAKGEFLANVSHELRPPVTVVRGIAFVLGQAQITDEERTEFLSRLQVAVDKLTGLVDNVLTIAELERGTLALQLTQTDVASLVTGVCDEVARKYPEVVVDGSLPPTTPCLVDPGRIAEVVRQLVDNACRYSPAGATVSVRIRSMEEGVTVTVTDVGEGLRREVVAMAFSEPFTAGEQVLRTERSGMGLGIHLARQLILMHGGIMWADPLPGGGTRVSFCIPRDQDRPISSPVGMLADGHRAGNPDQPGADFGTAAAVHPNGTPGSSAGVPHDAS
jgi:signal transduction histidine kinase